MTERAHVRILCKRPADTVSEKGVRLGMLPSITDCDVFVEVDGVELRLDVRSIKFECRADGDGLAIATLELFPDEVNVAAVAELPCSEIDEPAAGDAFHPS